MYEKIQEITQLVESGKSVIEACKAVGVSRSWLYLVASSEQKASLRSKLFANSAEKKKREAVAELVCYLTKREEFQEVYGRNHLSRSLSAYAKILGQDGMLEVSNMSGKIFDGKKRVNQTMLLDDWLDVAEAYFTLSKSAFNEKYGKKMRPLITVKISQSKRLYGQDSKFEELRKRLEESCGHLKYDARKYREPRVSQ